MVEQRDNLPPASGDSTSTERPNQQQQQQHDDTQKRAAAAAAGVEDDGQQDLTEEDLNLKTELEMLVQRLMEPDETLYVPALESLSTLIRTSTSSMTSVPKPLRFLRPHFAGLKHIYETWSVPSLRMALADLLSFLAMTYSPPEERESIKFRLLSESTSAVSWGHEYLRHLAAEICLEYEHRINNKADATDLCDLALIIVPFFLSHNAEADAVDLLVELEIVDQITPFVDENTFARVCLYLASCASYLPPPDDVACLLAAHAIYRKVQRIPEALIVALRLGRPELINDDYAAAASAPTAPSAVTQADKATSLQPKSENICLCAQLAYILARQNIVAAGDHPPDILEIFNNVKLSEHFKAFARELGVFEPKTPEDIYKSHLDTRPSMNIDSFKSNLAATFVNAFVNAGYSSDTLLLSRPTSWIYKTKDYGIISSTASIGMLMMWDVDAGLAALDQFIQYPDPHVQAGALLAVGILHAGVRNENDPAIAILSDFLDKRTSMASLLATSGLGIAYAGTEHPALFDLLIPNLRNLHELSCLTALALGLVYVGSCHGDLSSHIAQMLYELQFSDASESPDLFSATGDAAPAGLASVEVVNLLAPEAQLATGNAADEAAQNAQPTENASSAVTSAPADNSNVSNGPPPVETTTSSTAAETGEATSSSQDSQAADSNANASGAATEGSNATSKDTENIVYSHSKIRFMALGVGLLYLGSQEASDAILETLRALIDSAQPSLQNILRMFLVLIEGCAYAGTGNVLKVQAMLQLCSDHLKEHNEWQGLAVIAVALIAMGDDIGSEMALRLFDHFMRYGEPVIRRSVPLAIALLCVSNPLLPIMDTLSKYSHDRDNQVALRATFAMGVIGAGTNNARLAQMLRQLASYYHQAPSNLFIVRVAQGLLHLGKGTMTLNPYHSGRTLMSRVGLAGLLTGVIAMTDADEIVSGRSQWMLFHLANAISPRFLITLDADTRKPLQVSVRVGQAVDVVGQAGRPKTITGFQTHNTPVLLGHNDRAELATDEYYALTPVLEGFVLLKKATEEMLQSSTDSGVKSGTNSGVNSPRKTSVIGSLVADA